MYWNTVKDNTIDISKTPFYSKYENLQSTTKEGYRCDPMGPSPVLFLGSCDLNGPIEDAEQTWSKRIHTSLLKNTPYIALSRISTGLDAMQRRLFAYCQQYGPPNTVYAVLPRPLSIEIPIRGTLTDPLANVSDREKYVDYLSTNGLITPSEYGTCLSMIELARKLQNNVPYNVYKFEQASAFLQMMCERYSMEFVWVPNVSATAIDYYGRYLETLLRHVPFLSRTCLGVPKAVDFSKDGSAGQQTQKEIADTLMRKSPMSKQEREANLEANKLFLQSDEKMLGRCLDDTNRR